MNLFRWGAFTSAAGLELPFKIECHVLDGADWYCIARQAKASLPPFSFPVSVPRGGDMLARALATMGTGRSTDLPLIVDDVWTTGMSMMRIVYERQYNEWLGYVAFARGELPPNVKCFMRLG